MGTFEEEMQNERIPNDNWWTMMFHRTPEWTTWEEEQLSWKKSVSIWDLTGGQWYKLTGPDAARLLNDFSINNFDRSTPGTSRHLVLCRDDGKMLWDTVIMIFGKNDYQISSSITVLQYEMENKNYDVQFEPAPPRTTIQVSGPNSFKLLQRLTDTDLSTIKFSHFNPVPVKLAGYDTYMLRLTMSGELGFEVQAPAEARDEINQKIFEAGQDLGVRRIGARNHLSQHIESCMPLSMTDFMYATRDPGDPYLAWALKRDPFAALTCCPKISGSFEAESFSDYYASPVDTSWGAMVHLDHEFRGREALEKELAHPKRRMVTLEWNKEDVIDVYASMFSDGEPHQEVTESHYDYMEIPRDPKLPLEANTVLHDGKKIAFTTSRSYSYFFRRMLSLCMIPTEYSAPGTQVEIVWGLPGHRQKLVRATVQTAPYKENHVR